MLPSDPELLGVTLALAGYKLIQTPSHLDEIWKRLVRHKIDERTYEIGRMSKIMAK